MKESQPVQNSPIENIMRLDDMLEKSTCIDENTGTHIPIVNLLENNLDCHASALSDATSSGRINALVIVLLTVCFYYYE